MMNLMKKTLNKNLTGSDGAHEIGDDGKSANAHTTERSRSGDVLIQDRDDGPSENQRFCDEKLRF